MKRTNIINLLLLLVMVVLITNSCEYEYIQPEGAPIPDVVSFSTDIIPIFNSSCNTGPCHSTGGESPDLTAANAYQSLFDNNLIDTAQPENSILYQEISSGGMKSYSTSSNTELILTWIKQGAKNN